MKALEHEQTFQTFGSSPKSCGNLFSTTGIWSTTTFTWRDHSSNVVILTVFTALLQARSFRGFPAGPAGPHPRGPSVSRARDETKANLTKDHNDEVAAAALRTLGDFGPEGAKHMGAVASGLCLGVVGAWEWTQPKVVVGG